MTLEGNFENAIQFGSKLCRKKRSKMRFSVQERQGVEPSQQDANGAHVSYALVST